MRYRHHHIKPKIKKLKKRKKGLLGYPLVWVFIFCVITLFALLYLFIFSPKFQVEKIEITGNQKLQPDQIQTLAWQKINTAFLGISSQSIFLMSKDALRKELLKRFPELQDAQVQKKFPREVVLFIQERSPEAIYCATSSTCFYADGNGVIFEKVDQIPSFMMVIKNNRTEAKVGDTVIDKAVMEGLIKLKTELDSNFQISIKEVNTSDLVVVTTSESWKLYLDPKENLDNQITKLSALLKNQISAEQRAGLQYIYLQYKDRAYYK